MKTRILLDVDRVYNYDGPDSRDALLGKLAKHFKGFSGQLWKTLSFYDKLNSAVQYGLVTADIDQEALENLRELVGKCEFLERRQTA